MQRWTSLKVLLSLGALSIAGCDDGGGPFVFTPPGRTLEAVVTAERPPPLIAGGTLLATRDGHTVAGDPDRDALWLIDLVEGGTPRRVDLPAGSEPGRLAEGADGTVFAVMRGSGALVRLDTAAAAIDWSVRACDGPRGVTFDAATGVVHVACTGGTLATFSAADGSELRTVSLPPDLRDVVATGGRLYVSRFRSAEVLILDAEGRIESRARPTALFDGDLVPAVAWRMIAGPRGGVMLVHQVAFTDVGKRNQAAGSGSGASYYGGVGCGPSGPIVQTAVTEMNDGEVTTVLVGGAVLPVDMASSPDGTGVAIAAAGALNDDSGFGSGPTLLWLPIENLDIAERGGAPCEIGLGPLPGTTDGRQVVSLAFEPGGRLLSQARDPWEVRAGDHLAVSLPGESRKDSGHDLFHEDAGGGVACASCHAEGGDDGLVWRFPHIGQRRTQSLRGGILSTAPFHWDGEMDDLRMLVDEVFTTRMSGPELPERHLQALARYVDALPVEPSLATPDASAVSRGRALFESRETGCTSCHGGARLSNGGTYQVGTGGAFQVPSLLGVAYRAPYLHDGCAPTLRDRLVDESCGGGDRHGHTSQLTTSEIDDLVAYLGSL